MKLMELYNVARDSLLIACIEPARARRIYKRLLRDPGDCWIKTTSAEGTSYRKDFVFLRCLALAEAHVGRGPGWIPEVQRIACAIERASKERNKA